MKSALRYFVLATLGVLLLLFAAWVYVHHNAINKPVKPPLAHPFLERLRSGQPLVIAYQGSSLEAPPNTMIAFEKAAALGPDIALWVDVRPTFDGTLVVFEPKDLSGETDGQGWVQLAKKADLDKLDAGYRFTNDDGTSFPFRGQGLKIPTLSEVLTRFPDRFLVLNFQDYRAGVDTLVVNAIENAKASERVLISSPEDGILKDLRKLRPKWAFGTSQAQATVLLMLSELRLEAAASINGDVFVGPTAHGASLFRLSDPIAKELHRRKMKIVLGPAVDDDQALKWKAEGIEGIVTRDPSSLLR
ncbi:MAG: glycerophosphodiester phosphodiesterase family protein [Bdellovibrionota bacterium]